MKDRVRLTRVSLANLRKQFQRLGVDDATFWDVEVRGFGLRIRKGGAATWVYQYQRGTTQGKVRIGDATAMSAAQAEQRAREERAKRDLGGDPAAERAEARLKDKQTLRGVIEDYLRAKEHELRPMTLREARRFLRLTLAPLHDIPAHKVLKRDVARIVNGIAQTRNERTGKPMKATAAGALAHLSMALNWAIENDLIEANPASDIKSPRREARERVLNDRELAAVWRACDDGSDASRIVRLLILTGQRRDEISGMREEELDRHDRSWTLPVERSKNKRAHTLILPDMAWQLIGPPDRKGPLFGRSEHGYSGWQGAKKHLDKRSGVTGWTIHDIRRSVATGMAENEIAPQAPHIIEAVLNHISGHKGGIAGIYNRASYQREVRIALAMWADHIASITQDTDRKIIPIKPIPA